ncbi:hypothetical protein GCM10007890_02130 [Methylobacterium tardum]|uniref:Transposase n=1 Tax=Methylobacterium tardum TaxID=374432 RepID=A0AA37WPE9_9HYPH|nr:hypothetical protein GCM10007890_02130 [Methylobacterium tardum]
MQHNKHRSFVIPQVEFTPRLDPQTFKVKIAGSWQVLCLNEAMGAHNTAPKRCPECHGPILIASFGKALRRRLTDRKAHTGCPRIPSRYSGMPSRHPMPVI